MLELLHQNESRTLEFKENTQSLSSIIKTVVAFANTAGGVIIIGVSNHEKRIIGIQNPLGEEERLANVIADAITPLIIPDIQILNFREKELLIIRVPHVIGPFYLKSSGMERGTYVRIGSTSRLADSGIILSLQMLAKNTSFDELPCPQTTLADIDHATIQNMLSPIFGDITEKQYESLNIALRQYDKLYPTNGGILLFSQNRDKWFPDATIACVCFADTTCEEIIDQQEIKSPLIIAHAEIFAFIKRNTKMGAKIQNIREDIPQYPLQAIREAVINAIVHADYSIKGSKIQISIFSDRIEITNPGGLTYGQTMDLALSGVSLMRNRVIGRLFREIKLIERLGTGLKRIISVYEKINVKPPLFEELNNHFRVTLYSVDTLATNLELWERQLLEKLIQQNHLSTAEIAKFWGTTSRTARSRLKKMLDSGTINRVATSMQDPYAVFEFRKLTKRIEYKKCDISYTIYKDQYGGFSAGGCITIHAEDVLDTLFELEKSYTLAQLAENECIKKAKEWIDAQIHSGRLRPIKK